METIIERTTDRDQQIARDNLPQVKRLVTSFAKRTEPVAIQVSDHDMVSLQLPAKLFGVLQTILDLMAKGKAFSLIPANAELTTQEAADMLNVSRPHVVKLLKEGVIPYKEVGTHRRILLEDLVVYSRDMKQKRKEALEELARLGQQYNM
jgi:excisionase family DNA binding protein